MHTTIEEQVLYPVLPEITGGDALRQEAEREHQEVKDAIAEIERIGTDTPDAGRYMQTIIKGVTHHVNEEETELSSRSCRPKWEPSV